MALAAFLLKVAALGGALLLAQYVLAYLQSPLKKIPGPFLAKFSNVWRLWNHYSQTHIETQKKLHAQYGSAVRLGPNVVSVAEPSLVKTIYSTRGTFIKSDYYSVNDAVQGGHRIENIFGTRSNEFHSKQLKPVQKLYTFQSAYELEPKMNGTITRLMRHLDERFAVGSNKGKTCDIVEWINYFTWDFLSDMVFSQPMGFMDTGSDVQGMIANAEKAMRYFSVVGQVPEFDKYLAKNPYFPVKFSDFSATAGFCVQRFMERMQNLEQFKDKKDFMNGFLEAKKEYPDLVSDNEVIGYLIVTILGGADTTGILLKAIFYYILKNPAVQAKLVEEVRSSSLSFPASHQTLEKLPYLDACIKEGLRIHPVAGHILERIVPSSGLTLPNGTTIPPGTIVGMNPWVIQRDEKVFGSNPDQFIPERWLQSKTEDKEAYEVRMRAMKDADMSFGNGNRTCLGRPLALVELHKVTATLFANYEISLESPEQEWDLHKQWFVWPHDIKVKLSRHTA